MLRRICLLNALLILIGLCASPAFSADNYLLFRHDFSSDYKENTYVLFENNTSEDWAFNARLITVSDDLRIFLPTMYYKFGNGFQLGARANLDSLDGKYAGPVFRYKNPIGRFFTIFDASILKSLDLDDDDQFDIWFHSSTRIGETSWRYGIELRYCGAIGSLKHFQIRPARVTYDFNESISAFLMPQRQFSSDRKTSDSVMAGVEFKF